MAVRSYKAWIMCGLRSEKAGKAKQEKVSGVLVKRPREEKASNSFQASGNGNYRGSQNCHQESSESIHMIDCDYETGPFCRHFGDPADCEEVCKCGHPCTRHGFGDGDTSCNDCDCKEWQEADEQSKLHITQG